MNLSDCTLCPRKCHADRQHGQSGACHETNKIYISRAALHMWEEPCISGKEGSGAVFFNGCHMGCVFCQNRQISLGNAAPDEHRGVEVTIEKLADIFLQLQGKGANNLNLVSPTHYVVPIVQALELAAKGGFHLPVVYNSSGYENVETIKSLEGYVDVYLPDFKYYDDELAVKYSRAPGYREVAKKALREMVSQTGKPQFDSRGMMTKGVIVRHLMLPGQLMDSKRIVKMLYETFHDSIYLSLMNQYTPMPAVHDFPELCTKVKHSSYNKLMDYAINLGITNAFIQEGETAKESFIPDFSSHQGILE